jgi:hypothetical protein
MSQPRYQVFVSSTFRDLQEERQAVLKAILKLNQFPAGMEDFPAANDTAWEMIEKVIKDSDYYILIIGGKYGSIDTVSDISYTEKEYDFAFSQKIPVLAFIHSEPEKIARDKTEDNIKIRKKLDAFKRKVESRHHRNPWRTVDELRENVSSSLSQSILSNPQKGWVKAGGIERDELLERLANLQKRFDDVVAENNKLKESAIFFDTGHFLRVDDLIRIKFKFADAHKEIDLTLNQILLGIGEHLLIQCEIEDVKVYLEAFVLEYFKKSPALIEDKELEFMGIEYEHLHRVYINEQSSKEIEIQLLALELISVSDLIKQYSDIDLFDIMNRENPIPTTKTKIVKTWQLTDKGRKLFLSQKAILREQIDDTVN